MNNIQNKLPVIFLVLLACAFTGHAQSAYKGGKGDGYDMAEVSRQSVHTKELNGDLARVSIYPSVMSVGESFHLDAPKHRTLEHASIQLVTVDGEVIKRWESGEAGKMVAPEQSGVYLLNVQIDKRRKAFKIMVK